MFQFFFLFATESLCIKYSYKVKNFCQRMVVQAPRYLDVTSDSETWKNFTERVKLLQYLK